MVIAFIYHVDFAPFCRLCTFKPHPIASPPGLLMIRGIIGPEQIVRAVNLFIYLKN